VKPARVRLFALLLSLLAAAACSRDSVPARAPAERVKLSARVAEPAPSPAEPAAPDVSVPTLAAELAGPDGGPSIPVSGPAQPSFPRESADAPLWRLASSPSRLVWQHPHPTALEVELVDGRGRAWPSRVELDGRKAAVLKPLKTLPAGASFKLVVKEGADTWEQPLEVAPARP
jgi:hypothetical protein